MYVYIKQLGIVCLLCWLGLSCTLQRTEHPALRQAGYLMEEHSDSAFSLLKSISSLTGMSPEDKAGYALLLAEAADKNGYSLLPCDSLLNFALHGSPDKPGGLSIQLCKSEKKEFYIRYSS